MVKYIIILFLLFTNCSKASSGYGQTVIRFLFVGNSLTYTNNLPAIIKELGMQDNVTVTYTEILLPDYSFEDHWNDGKVQQEIESKKYDYVIAQQGPSALPASQVLLLDYATRLANLCKANNTKFALYMVWPSISRDFDLDNVIFSYTQAASQTGSLLCPAGLAWKYAWQINAQLPLYSSDGFHPSIAGTVLAALTIYAALKDKNNFEFVTYSNVSWKNDVPEGQYKTLKQAALKALIK